MGPLDERPGADDVSIDRARPPSAKDRYRVGELPLCSDRPRRLLGSESELPEYRPDVVVAALLAHFVRAGLLVFLDDGHDLETEVRERSDETRRFLADRVTTAQRLRAHRVIGDGVGRVGVRDGIGVVVLRHRSGELSPGVFELAHRSSPYLTPEAHSRPLANPNT